MTENIPKKYLHVAIGLDYELSTGRSRDLKTHSHLHGKSDTKRHADTRIRSNTQKTRWDKKCEWKWWSGKKHIFKVNRKRQSRVKIARGIRCLLADWLVGSWMMNASSDEAAAAEKKTPTAAAITERKRFSHHFKLTFFHRRHAKNVTKLVVFVHNFIWKHIKPWAPTDRCMSVLQRLFGAEKMNYEPTNVTTSIFIQCEEKAH